jgi:hypothetical protein
MTHIIANPGSVYLGGSIDPDNLPDWWEKLPPEEQENILNSNPTSDEIVLGPPPTEEELKSLGAKMYELEQTNWLRNRISQYPPIGDQLDALYHAGVFPEEMAAVLASVKSNNPKPE